MIDDKKILELSCLSLGSTIGEALERINAMPSSMKFQIVLNNINQVIGVLTDGDLRRAIILGRDIKSLIDEHVNSSFASGRVGDSELNIRLLNSLTSNVKFLPILDENKNLISILTDENISSEKLKCIVMAGGFGKRLGQLTKNNPKPLVNVAGKPIIDHIIPNIIQSGINDISVSLHYRSAMIREHLNKKYKDISFNYLIEKQPLGTAGSIGLMSKKNFDGLLVINADLITTINLEVLYKFHFDQKFDITICVINYFYEVPYGVVNFNNDGKFDNLEEKPRHKCFVSAGIYMISKKVSALVKLNEKIDMPELISRSKKQNLAIGVFPISEYWKDLGTKGDIDSAELSYNNFKINAKI